jgi:hypothetical protein
MTSGPSRIKTSVLANLDVVLIEPVFRISNGELLPGRPEKSPSVRTDGRGGGSGGMVAAPERHFQKVTVSVAAEGT